MNVECLTTEYTIQGKRKTLRMCYFDMRSCFSYTQMCSFDLRVKMPQLMSFRWEFLGSAWERKQSLSRIGTEDVQETQEETLTV